MKQCLQAPWNFYAIENTLLGLFRFRCLSYKGHNLVKVLLKLVHIYSLTLTEFFPI